MQELNLILSEIHVDAEYAELAAKHDVDYALSSFDYWGLPDEKAEAIKAEAESSMLDLKRLNLAADIKSLRQKIRDKLKDLYPAIHIASGMTMMCDMIRREVKRISGEVAPLLAKTVLPPRSIKTIIDKAVDDVFAAVCKQCTNIIMNLDEKVTQ
jgi:hypothetical protein